MTKPKAKAVKEKAKVVRICINPAVNGFSVEVHTETRSGGNTIYDDVSYVEADKESVKDRISHILAGL